ncbi:hypothetical protein SDC9_212103 [bioreactor metagenome]|uniref:Uncharacterized protein n=1 Tax=bioreactor metagenome TaxID=1076179 RepID=A0A645JL61_9ZZZZ
MTVEMLAEVELTGALGHRRQPVGDGRLDRGPQSRVVTELGRMHLRKPAADVETGQPSRQFGIDQRIDLDDAAAGRPQQFGGLGVAEGEGTPGQHPHHRTPVDPTHHLNRRPGRRAHRGRLRCECV